MEEYKRKIDYRDILIFIAILIVLVLLAFFTAKILVDKNSSNISVNPYREDKTNNNIPVKEDKAKLESITLDVDNLISVGDKKTIKVSFYPSTVIENITWFSSNDSVVSVYNGVVTAKDIGKSTITAKTTSGIQKQVEIEVYRKAESLILDKQNIELSIGESSSLIATVIPNDATYSDLTWSSSNSSVASVENGTIIAKKSGTATITVENKEGISQQCTVFVKSSISSNISTSKRNALKKAESYLSIMAFSRSGLIEQLEYEKFSTEDAIYAVDNCKANWSEQALKKAKSYLSTMAFSQKGLIEQLEFEKFTSEQAKYGVDNCGADWFEQAAKKAKSYLSVMGFSRGGLIEQLEFEGFTHEQAVYGVEANGL